MDHLSAYKNRDLSQLDFNKRILAEATDKSVPLLDRIVFLGIFSNNIDEFVRTRLARLEGELHHLDKKKSKKAAQSKQLLVEIGEQFKRISDEFCKIYDRLWKEMAGQKIVLVDETRLTKEQGEFVRRYFCEKVRQNITPILLEQLARTDYLREQSPQLIVELRGGKSDRTEPALIEIPSARLPRFLVLPENARGETPLMFMDDVLRYCLDDLFRPVGYEPLGAWSIQFFRDENIEIDKDKKDYLADLRQSLGTRSRGEIIRLLYDVAMPPEVLARVAGAFGVRKKRFLKEAGKYLRLNDLMSIGDLLGRERLQAEPLPVVPCAALPEDRGILDSVREQDILLSYPYQSFEKIVDLLLQSSIDPKVTAIKMTIYRAAKNSRVINALVNAARNGKQVTAYVELQASFDEEANIDWAKKMDDEGIRTVYYAPGGLKVHSKLLLVSRLENGEKVDYTAIGTGNPNEKTSRIYCDHHLLTVDRRLTSDVEKVFKLLESRKLREPKFRSLVVSPFSTRSTFMALLDREIKHAAQGREAWAIIKLNNLADREIVGKMYEASQAGVRIRCIIRGICIMVPGLDGLSENITAVRIVDRFLEHARIMVFANAGDPEYFMGSADWMGRNFDNRVEVTTPIYDKSIKELLDRILEIQLADNVKATPINGSTSSAPSKKKVRSQMEIHALLRKRNES